VGQGGGRKGNRVKGRVGTKIEGKIPEGWRKERSYKKERKEKRKFMNELLLNFPVIIFS
jgi:hypothetical protein